MGPEGSRTAACLSTTNARSAFDPIFHVRQTDKERVEIRCDAINIRGPSSVRPRDVNCTTNNRESRRADHEGGNICSQQLNWSIGRRQQRIGRSSRKLVRTYVGVPFHTYLLPVVTRFTYILFNKKYSYIPLSSC